MKQLAEAASYLAKEAFPAIGILLDCGGDHVLKVAFVLNSREIQALTHTQLHTITPGHTHNYTQVSLTDWFHSL